MIALKSFYPYQIFLILTILFVISNKMKPSLEAFFLTWQATMVFFALNIRKAIYVDGTFIKFSSRRNLLTKDSCERLSLLALAVLSSESEENWKYILEKVKIHFECNNSSVVIISDRKGLVKSIESVFPLASAVHCALD